MANADGAVIIDITADPKQAVNGINRVERSVNNLSSAAKKIAGVFAAAFAVDKVVQFGKEAIELGSNVAEIQNVVDIAFGDMAYKAEAFAGAAIESFGMSTLAAKKTASTYMAMAKNMGLSMDAASDMAITLTGLTGDVASFYNISQELADIKLKSVFTGETETLKDLGIVMTQANLEAYALSQGITKSIGSMSQAELVTLRYNFVLDQLAMASGDFVRTQDSWANQTRILSMQWQEFMSIVGQALTQVLLPIVKVLNTLVSSLISMANALNSAISSIFGGENTQVKQTEANVSGISSGIGEAVENQDALTDATKETNKEQAKSLAGFDEINTLAGEAAVGSAAGGSVSGGGAGLGGGEIATFTPENRELVESEAIFSSIEDAVKNLMGLCAPLKSAFENAFASINTGASSLLSVFQGAWEDIKTLGSPLLSWFSEDYIPFLARQIEIIAEILGGVLDSLGLVLWDVWSILIFPMFEKFITDILPFFTEVAGEINETLLTLFNRVKEIFDRIWAEGVAPALELIQKIWSDTWDSIIAAWEKWGQPIFDGIREAVNNVADHLLNVWETILKPVWDNFMEVVTRLWDEHLRPLLDNFLDFVGKLVDGALRIYNEFIAPLVTWFVDVFGPPIAEVINEMVAAFGDLFGIIADVASGVLESLGGVIDFVVGVFTGDWEKAWDGIKGIFSGVWNGIVSTLEGAVNLIIRGINWVINRVNGLIGEGILSAGLELLGVPNGKIPTIAPLSLPRLAQGSIIPPNREFLAVLGDNKQEPEVVSPLSTMKQAFLEAMQEAGGLGGRAQQINLVVDGRTLATVIVPQINRMTQQAGKPVLLI